jgi:hypothetical protein
MAKTLYSWHSNFIRLHVAPNKIKHHNRSLGWKFLIWLQNKNEHETWTIYLMWIKPPFLGWNEVEGFWVKQKVKTWGEVKMFKHIESVKCVGVKGRIPLNCKSKSVQNLWIKVWRVKNLVQIGLCLEHWKGFKKHYNNL